MPLQRPFVRILALRMDATRKAPGTVEGADRRLPFEGFSPRSVGKGSYAQQQAAVQRIQLLSPSLKGLAMADIATTRPRTLATRTCSSMRGCCVPPPARVLLAVAEKVRRSAPRTETRHAHAHTYSYIHTYLILIQYPRNPTSACARMSIDIFDLDVAPVIGVTAPNTNVELLAANESRDALLAWNNCPPNAASSSICLYPKLDLDASAASHPSQTSTIPYHTSTSLSLSLSLFTIIYSVLPPHSNLPCRS